MNADASPGVALHGSLGAKAPLLPWVAGALLLVPSLTVTPIERSLCVPPWVGSSLVLRNFTRPRAV